MRSVRVYDALKCSDYLFIDEICFSMLVRKHENHKISYILCDNKICEYKYSAQQKYSCHLCDRSNLHASIFPTLAVSFFSRNQVSMAKSEAFLMCSSLLFSSVTPLIVSSSSSSSSHSFDRALPFVSRKKTLLNSDVRASRETTPPCGDNSNSLALRDRARAEERQKISRDLV